MRALASLILSPDPALIKLLLQLLLLLLLLYCNADVTKDSAAIAFSYIPNTSITHKISFVCFIFASIILVKSLFRFLSNFVPFLKFSQINRCHWLIILLLNEWTSFLLFQCHCTVDLHYCPVIYAPWLKWTLGDWDLFPTWQ